MRKRQIVSLVLAILMCFCMINVAFAQEKNSVEGFTLGPNYSITRNNVHSGGYAIKHENAESVTRTEEIKLDKDAKYRISVFVYRDDSAAASISIGSLNAESKKAGEWEELSFDYIASDAAVSIELYAEGNVIFDDLRVIPYNGLADNLVKNGNFAKGTENWSANGTAPFVGGTGHLIANNLHDFRYNGGVDVEPDSWYLVSADFFSNTNGVRPWLYLDMANTANEVTLRVTRQSDTEWQTVSALWYSGSSTNTPLRLVADYNLDRVNGGLVPFSCTMPYVTNVSMKKVNTQASLVGNMWNLDSNGDLSTEHSLTGKAVKLTDSSSAYANGGNTIKVKKNTNYVISAYSFCEKDNTNVDSSVILEDAAGNALVTLKGTMYNQAAAKDASKYAGSLSMDIDWEYLGTVWNSGDTEEVKIHVKSQGTGNSYYYDSISLVEFAGNELGANIFENGNMEKCHLDITSPEVEKGEDLTNIIKSGKEYSFMNCDTGRTIMLGKADEFVVEKDGADKNIYVIKDSQTGKYIDLSQALPTLSEEKISYLIYKSDYDRYQIVLNGNYAIYDTDEQTGVNAVLAKTERSANPEEMNINTGWYLTLKGDLRPLKVMPLGDSITYGVDDDIDASLPRVGYRKILSEELMDYFGRVVLVGDKKTETGIYVGSGQSAYETTLKDKMLLRHAGRPGWTINGSPYSANPGLDGVIDGIKNKYKPDIVCLMIGTNDCGVMSGGSYSDAAMTQKIKDAKKFVKRVEKAVSENGLIIYASLSKCSEGGTKYGGSFMHTIMKDFNKRLEPMIQELSDSGVKVAFTDNYTNVNKVGNPLGVDGLHLNEKGHEAMAKSYLDVIKSAYGKNSVKKMFKINMPESEGFAFTRLSRNVVRTVEPGNSISFKVSVKEGYTPLTAVKANGKRLTPVKGLYTIKNILSDVDITVEGVNIKTYNVTVNCTNNGSVDKQSETVNHGSDLEIKVTPDNGFAPKATVNGKTAEIENGVLKIENITENIVVDIMFEAQKYTVEIVNPENGKITADTTEPAHGEKVTLKVIANKGYEVKGILVNGQKVTDKDSYALEITENIRVEALIEKTQTDGEKVPTDSEKTSDSGKTEGKGPKTGDFSSGIIWTVLLIAALAGVAIVTIKRSRKEER